MKTEDLWPFLFVLNVQFSEVCDTDVKYNFDPIYGMGRAKL